MPGDNPPKDFERGRQMEIARRLALYVREEMEARGWTQVRTSMKTGVIGPPMLTRILQGTVTRMTVDQLIGLSRAFQVQPQEILEKIGEWPLDDYDSVGYLHHDLLHSVQRANPQTNEPEDNKSGIEETGSSAMET